MTFRSMALSFDAQKKPIEAAWAYEITINEPDCELEIFLNLAMLYFEFRDFGYAAHHHLSDDFVSGAWQRAFEILELAEERFGDQTEVIFWQAYFSYIYEENEQIDNICRKLVSRKDSLVPYLYLFTSSDKEEYSDKIQQLLETVKGGETERKRYIRSVIE